MFCLFPIIPYLPRYDIKSITNHIDDESIKAKLEEIEKANNLFNYCTESYNGNVYEEYVKKYKIMFLNMLNNKEIYFELLKKYDKLSFSCNFIYNYSFGNIHNTNTNSTIYGDLILSKLSFSIINMWGVKSEINKLCDIFIKDKKVDQSLLNIIKDSLYESILRVYILINTRKDDHFLKFEIKNIPELSPNFIEFIMITYEINLAFIVVFQKLDVSKVEEIYPILDILKYGLKKTEFCLKFSNNLGVEFKTHLINYFILINQFIELCFSYYKIKEYNFYINKGKYPSDLNYEQTIYNRFIFALRSKQIYEENVKMSSSFRDVFNLLKYNEVIKSFYINFLEYDENEAIKMYNDLKDKLVKANKYITIFDVINGIDLGNDIIKKAVESKAKGLQI